MMTLRPHLHRALEALRDAATTLAACIATAIAACETATLPRRLRAHPARAQAHVAYVLDWIAALARTLAGDTYFLPPYRLAFPRFPGRFPSFTNELRALCGLPLNPPPTDAQRAANRLRYMRRVFATEPTGVIAARIARRLGIARASEQWPAELVAITETPATLCRPPRTPPAPTAAEPQAAPAPIEPPPFHKRE